MDRAVCAECGGEAGIPPFGQGCPACLLSLGCDENDPQDFGENDGARARSVSDETSRIGPYHLIRVIGEGGMGTVYLAERIDRLHRRVALKLVRDGLGGREVRSRFEHERQTISRMEHRGIARVLDAGETDSGKPYFVMELFEGLPITDYCDSRGLGMVPRLELFLRACDAVEHAHRKGVIHRDLKPSNLLVAENAEGEAELKVIDFGIAKAIGDDISDTLVATVATSVGQVVGTPQYMSPEQAASAPPDTRTDVHGLGTVLYELLAGSAPLRSGQLRGLSFEGLMRLVREKEPERPTVRVGAMTPEERSGFASCRGESAETWIRRLRGDLDWIALRSLEKEPERRYPSVAALAADIERHLEDQPVEACPPSTAYRLLKFFRRNRTLTSSAAIIVCVLVTATFLSVRWALEAGEARRLAESRLAQADSVPEFLMKAFSKIDPVEGSKDLLAVEVIDEAVKEADVEFSDQPLMRARIFESLARINLRLSRYEQAETLADTAIKTCDLVPGAEPDLRSRLSGILTETRRLQGRSSEAIALSEQNWRDARARAGAGSSEETAAFNEWVINLINAGELDRAEAALDEAEASSERSSAANPVDFKGLYGSLRWAQGRHDEARNLMESRLANHGASFLVSTNDLMWKFRHYARLLADMGRYGETAAWGEALVRCATDVYDIDHDLAIEAIAIHSRAVARSESADDAYFLLSLAKAEVVARNPAAPRLAHLENHLSAFGPSAPLAATIDGWFGEPEWKHRHALEIPPQLATHPSVWTALADHWTRTGFPDRAIAAAQRACDLSRRSKPEGAPTNAVRLAQLVSLLAEAGRLDDAESVMKESWKPQLIEAPTGRFLIDACDRLSDRLGKAGNVAHARELDRAQLFPALVPLTSAMNSTRISQVYHRIFKHLSDQKLIDEQIRFQERVVRELRPSLPMSDRFRRLVEIRLCEMLLTQKREKEARAHYNALKEAVNASNESLEIEACLDLLVLESKFRRTEGDHEGAGELLLTGLKLASADSGGGMEGAPDERSRRILRMRTELRNHYASVGDESSRCRWTSLDLLEAVGDTARPDMAALAENGDMKGLVELLEKEETTTTLAPIGEIRKSLELAEWLADEFQRQGEVHLTARAAMEALRRYRRLGTGTTPILRQRFLQVQKGQSTLANEEAKLAQATEIEEIFARLLGRNDRQTWIMRVHRLVFLHDLGAPDQTRLLIDEYFNAFPDESEDRQTLRLWYYNHRARCLLDLGEIQKAGTCLLGAESFAKSLIGTPGVVEAELRRARIMTSNLLARFHHENGEEDLGKLRLKQAADLEAEGGK